MEFPISCREAAERLAETVPLSELRAAVSLTTEKYKESSGRGQRLVSDRTSVIAYASTRMPATFGAVSSCLLQLSEALPAGEDPGIRTVLDLGAGTGAGGWAVMSVFPEAAHVTACEREEMMMKIGKTLAEGTRLADVTEWIRGDAVETAEALVRAGKTFDLVLASYVTNEMTAPVRVRLLDAMWALTGKFCLLIEPGTPVGYAIIRSAREQFTANGAVIAAPCPSVGVCPLAKDDWCHFTCRVQRSKLHKLLKGGDVPYEDEKFSYLALSRPSVPCIPAAARVLRHPVTEAGRITLTLCRREGDGSLSHKTEAVTKRDKASFSAARKADCGSRWEKKP